MQHKSICFIGGGNMAQAIVFGLLERGYPADLITVCDPNQHKLDLFQKHGVQISMDNQSAVEKSEVLLLAVKPQVAAEVCASLVQGSSAVDFSNKLVISIMAAISVERIEQLLPTAKHIARVMPNTPALVAKGMSGLFAPSTLSLEYRQFTQDLMNAVGLSCWVEDEQQMHLVTAGSGSSPAYFFLFMQAMQQALLNMGLNQEQARLLVQQSALGAAQMAIQNPQSSLQQLRENVTSKGGTTAAAIAFFEQQNLMDTVERAMQVCVTRSEEMEQLF